MVLCVVLDCVALCWTVLGAFGDRDGAHVCEGLFKHHVNPDGTVVHWYHFDPIFEQIPEEAGIIPVPPTSLSDLLQDAATSTPDIPTPTRLDASQAMRAASGVGWNTPEDAARGSGRDGEGGKGAAVQRTAFDPFAALLRTVQSSAKTAAIPSWQKTSCVAGVLSVLLALHHLHHSFAVLGWCVRVTTLCCNVSMHAQAHCRDRGTECCDDTGHGWQYATLAIQGSLQVHGEGVWAGCMARKAHGDVLVVRCDWAITVVSRQVFKPPPVVEDSWNPSMSVFAPRARSSESKGFYDTAKVCVLPCDCEMKRRRLLRRLCTSDCKCLHCVPPDTTPCSRGTGRGAWRSLHSTCWLASTHRREHLA